MTALQLDASEQRKIAALETQLAGLADIASKALSDLKSGQASNTHLKILDLRRTYKMGFDELLKYTK